MDDIKRESGLVIAVDFDGTIVEHKYPEIGKEMMFATDTLKALQEKGHRLILWTYRVGKELDDAVDFCKQRGVEFYAVNKNYLEEVIDATTPRKLNADIFIDDRNIGGFLGWGEVWQRLHPNGRDFEHVVKNAEAHNNYPKKSFFAKIFGSK